MALGSLTRGLSKAGLWPLSEAPFPTVHFKQMSQSNHNIKIIDLCEEEGHALINAGTAHGNKTVLDDKIKALEGQLCGLDIEDIIEGESNGNGIEVEDGDDFQGLNDRKLHSQASGSPHTVAFMAGPFISCVSNFESSDSSFLVTSSK
jgi:hypothetical protein